MLPSIVATMTLAGTLASTPARAAETWPDISSPPRTRTTRDRSTDVALIIAVQDYYAAQDIPGAISNGRAWYRYLKDARGVGTIKTLENGAATREEILAAAEGLADRVESGSRIWIVYIGHGAPDATGDGGMLVGVDAQQNAMSLQARSVRIDELEAALSGAQAEVLLVQDACFSGKSSGGDLAPGLAPLKAVSTRLSPQWTVLSAGQNNEYAGPLSDGSRPAFSYLVLGALRGWGDANDDGTVTAAEAVDYASDAIFQTITGRTQRPQHTGPDLPLSTGRERGPSLAGLAASVVVPAAVPGVTSVPVGEATANLGSDADFTALAAEAAAKKAAASEAQRALREAEEAQRRLDEALQQERRRKLNAKIAQVRADAKRDYAAIETLVRTPTPEGRTALKAYLKRYAHAEVEVDGVKQSVHLDEVRRVEHALARSTPTPRPPRPSRDLRRPMGWTGAAAGIGVSIWAFGSGRAMEAQLEKDVRSGALSPGDAAGAQATANTRYAIGYGALAGGLASGWFLGMQSVSTTPSLVVGFRRPL